MVGTRLWPAYAAKSVGLLFLVAAVLAALGGLVQINPVWLWGPYEPDPRDHRRPARLVRRVPRGRAAPGAAVELHASSATPSPELFLPGGRPARHHLRRCCTPGRSSSGGSPHDRAEHHLLDRPRDRPVRTAIGVGVLTFYTVLTLAGGQDIIAQHLGVSIAVGHRHAAHRSARRPAGRRLPGLADLSRPGRGPPAAG